LTCPCGFTGQVGGRCELRRREHAVLAAVSPREQFEATVLDEFLKLWVELLARAIELGVVGEKAGCRKDLQLGRHHAQAGRSHACGIELARFDPLDEVTVAALTAARKDAQLDSALGLLLKRAAPRLENLDERRPGRRQRGDPDRRDRNGRHL
jgi:hypothetical protein